MRKHAPGACFLHSFMKQIANPYLPSFEYIPDGEPHVFGNRIYLYGSHDRFKGAGFCLNDYVCYSADVKDLTEWKYEGVIYKKEQDPRNQNIPADAPELPFKFGILPEGPEDVNPRGVHAMWAPDVVQGADGRYYLYYCLDFLPEIAVAVCDGPAGAYEFYGFVRRKDGTILGDAKEDLIQFDPGVFRDEDGTVYLYSGNAPRKREEKRPNRGSQVMRLEDDMLTLKEEPKLLIPDVWFDGPTGYEGHEFFEASSIRKINGLYYLVYSSIQSHELCYAVSSRPDADFRFGGTLVDLADVFLNGRTEEEAVNPLGNTHGGIEKANGQWYVFYHRQTNRTNFSRQGCAEKIFFDENGHIAQAEVTSCGLNKGPLDGEGMYQARICCHLTAANGAVHSHPLKMKMDYPFPTQDGKDLEPTGERISADREIPIQYIRNLQDGSTAGYKYFAFRGEERVSAEMRGNGEGFLEIRTEYRGKVLGTIPVSVSSSEWTWTEAAKAAFPAGTAALYLTYKGTGSVDFRRFFMEEGKC